jgi:hypothetical protein
MFIIFVMYKIIQEESFYDQIGSSPIADVLPDYSSYSIGR